MSGSPSVSVVVPTKKRPAELARAIGSILRGTALPRELIVVDQSADDLSEDAVGQLFREAPQCVRGAVELVYVHDPQISGAATARNRGIEAARGDIWLFIDDDMVAEPEFVEKILEAYRRKPDAAGVSGVVTNYSPPDSIYRWWSVIFARGPFFDERQPIYWNADRLRNAGPIKVRMLGGGMTGFRASALAQTRFDPKLSGASLAEDADLTLALSESGASLYIAPAARIEHRHSSVGRAGDHWLRAHAQASHYLYYRHWRKGLRNRICFAWLNFGYAVAAVLGCAKRRSLEPCRSLRMGARRAREIAFG